MRLPFHLVQALLLPLFPLFSICKGPKHRAFFSRHLIKFREIATMITSIVVDTHLSLLRWWEGVPGGRAAFCLDLQS